MKFTIFFTLIIGLMHPTINAQMDSLVHDGLQRTYLVHLPDSYNPSKEYSLVIAMHGGFGSATNLQNQSQLSKKSDEAGFIVVYPEGIKGGVLNIRTWNAGWCCGNASNLNIDDVGFIDQLITKLSEEYSIDLRRVYATGMSNGGFMSYRLACELPDRIAAIAPVAASMSMVDCSPTRPIPIIHFHSFMDTNVPYLGGKGSGTSSHHNPPLDSVLGVWSDLNGCNANWIIEVNSNEYLFEKKDQCKCMDYEIHKYITHDGGHSWPGGRKTIIGDPTSKFINANDLMWNFFQNYSIDCQLTDTEDNQLRSDISVFPNPSRGQVKVVGHLDNNKTEIIVTDINGYNIPYVMKDRLIDLSHLSPGVYFIQIWNKSNNSNFKVIITD